MNSRNTWLVAAMLFLAVCAGGLFLRGNFRGFEGTGQPAENQDGIAVKTADPTSKNKRDGASRAERERIAKHNERLERLSREATAAAKKSIAASRSLPPPIIAVASGGGLHPAVIEQLSLSPSEVKAMQAAISESQSKEAESFAARAEKLPVTEDMVEGSVKYLVRAKPDRGAAETKRLGEQVSQILDEARTKQFIGGIGEFDFYGGFGKGV